MFSRNSPLLKATGALLLPLLGTCVLAKPAHAVSLSSGDFNFSNWTLYRTTNGGAPELVSDPAYLCPTPYAGELSCIYVTDPNADPASFAVYGSDAPDIGAVGDQVDIAWTMQYNGPPGQLAFTMDYASTDTSASDYGYFQMNNVTVPGYSLSSAPTSPLTYSRPLNTGDFITFGVYSSGNDGGEGNLLISNLQLLPPVPGPLPALGAAGAWAWSRRLRSRIRRRSS